MNPTDTPIQTTQSDMQDKIEKIFNSILKSKDSFGVSLRIERGNGEVISNLAGGNLEIESQYFIASTTKLYTTAIIFKLISEEKLNLEDKLAKFFDANTISGLNVFRGQDYSSEINVRQLLAHTSGIPDYFSGKNSLGVSLEARLMKGVDEKWDFEKALTYAKTLKSPFYPGQQGKAEYSDTNFQILGRIIEILREKKIEEVFKEEIFDFLNLKKTYCFTGSGSQKPIPLYYKNSELVIPKAMSSFGADGGIVSTSQELMIFLKAFFQGKMFPIEYINLMREEYNHIFFPLQYGVGIMKFQLPRIFTLFKVYPELLGHSGLSGAFAFYAPEKDIYMTGTTNQLAARGRSYEMMVRVLGVV